MPAGVQRHQTVHRRFLGFHWLPGAIVTEFVSTNARRQGSRPILGNREGWSGPGAFAGSPADHDADYLFEGATARRDTCMSRTWQTPAAGLLLPAYYNGRNLAESFLLSIRSLSGRTW